MKKYFLSIFIFSIMFCSDLSNWIQEKTKYIVEDRYSLTFYFTVEKSKKDLKNKDLTYVEFYSLNKDSSVILIDGRKILCFKDRMETIDMISSQRFIEPLDQEFQDLRNKITSIFKVKNYKLFEISDSNYFLSLDDYFINMNIKYVKDESNISDISFLQAPYWIYVEELNINSNDKSLDFFKDIDSFEVFDLR